MATLTTALADLRSRLEESSARYWTDSELTTWLNEGQRVIARRAETIQSFNTSISAVVGQQKYSMPTDMIRVHRVEFVPTGQTQIYPLKPSTDDEMESIVGINPLMQSSYPSFFTFWGMPGGTGTAAMQMKVYPVPAQTGTFYVYYYREPVAVVNPGDSFEIPAGWDDLLPLYAESIALLKDRDDRWKDVRQLFETEMNYLVDVTRQWHDQQRVMQMPTGVSTPAWLYTFEDV